MPLIELHAVSHDYPSGGGTRSVLRDLTLALTEHRIGVIGANGSGKSTFVRLLNGLVVPTRGRVSIDGADTRRDGKAIRRRVGFCFTDPDAQIVMPTVAEDVAFGLTRRGMTKAEAAQRVAVLLAEYGLADHADHPAHLLSGGQKQLLALCSVMATEPELLVLDEPTTLLDLANTLLIADTIARLPAQVVMVTHDLDLLADFDRVVVFDDAAVVCDDVPTVAIDHYRSLVAGRR